MYGLMTNWGGKNILTLYARQRNNLLELFVKKTGPTEMYFNAIL